MTLVRSSQTPQSHQSKLFFYFDSKNKTLLAGREESSPSPRRGPLSRQWGDPLLGDTRAHICSRTLAPIPRAVAIVDTVTENRMPMHPATRCASVNCGNSYVFCLTCEGPYTYSLRPPLVLLRGEPFLVTCLVFVHARPGTTEHPSSIHCALLLCFCWLFVVSFSSPFFLCVNWRAVPTCKSTFERFPGA